MIKLERLPKPDFLSTEKVNELTTDFINTGNSVWNIDHIKNNLLLSSNNKCAYCECLLTKESNYMEVEHFEDKSSNPHKVVLWDNLLPACKRCNGAKGTHDVIAEPIINPFNENPKDHLAMRFYRMRGKTAKGKCTIEVTNLNHPTRLVMSRFEIGNKLHELIEDACAKFDIYRQKKDNRSKNKLIGIVEGMLTECQPSSSYSASTATVLITDLTFNTLVEDMKAENVWIEDLETYYRIASQLVLDLV